MRHVASGAVLVLTFGASLSCAGPIGPGSDAAADRPSTTDSRTDVAATDSTPADTGSDTSTATDSSMDTGGDDVTTVSDANGTDSTAIDAIDATVGMDSGRDVRTDTVATDVRPDAPRDVTAGDSSVVGSAGCGRSATPGVTHPTLRVGMLDRTYVLSIPTGYDPRRPLPLVFAWHGRRGSGTNFRGGGTSYGGGVERSSAGRAIFVYPDGLPVTSDPGDTGWIDVDFNSRDFALFDALLAHMQSTLCIDSTRVFSYGHSFGAYMTQGLGCRRPTVVRGIAAVAGGPPYQSSTCPGGAVPAWIDNAQNDDVVDYTTRGIPARNYWIRANSCSMTTMPVAPTPCVAYQGCTEPLHWCAPTTGMHSFPSFAYDGIWNFFAML